MRLGLILPALFLIAAPVVATLDAATPPVTSPTPMLTHKGKASDQAPAKHHRGHHKIHRKHHRHH
jgi:hypothetical protein